MPTGLRLNAYSKNGRFRWSFFGDEHNTTNDLTAPDVASDGNIYINRNLSELYSLTPAPAVRWIVPSLLIYSAYYWAPDGTHIGYLRFFLTVFPGLAIFLTVLSFNLVGDGLRDATDPRHSSRQR